MTTDNIRYTRVILDSGRIIGNAQVVKRLPECRRNCAEIPCTPKCEHQRVIVEWPGGTAGAYRITHEEVLEREKAIGEKPGPEDAEVVEETRGLGFQSTRERVYGERDTRPNRMFTHDDNAEDGGEEDWNFHSNRGQEEQE